MAISWRLHQRWAGEALLSRRFATRTRWYMFFLCLSLLNVGTDAFVGKWNVRESMLAAIWAIMILFARFIASRFEIRDRGILFQGSFYSWLEIEGYLWEGSWRGKAPAFYAPLQEDTESLLLRVRQNSIFSSPMIRIPVTSNDIAAVDSFMRQNLCPIPQVIEGAVTVADEPQDDGTAAGLPNRG